MAAPINTGDFWITQKIRAPYVDPEYTYPASVLAMDPAPLALFRLEEEDKSPNAVCVNTQGTGNGVYRGPCKSVEGMTRCDCGVGLWTGTGDNSGVAVWDATHLVVDTLDLTFVVCVSPDEFISTDHTIWHRGNVGVSDNQGLRLLLVGTSGALVFSWYSSGWRSKAVGNFTAEVGEEYVIGVSFDANGADVYVDGSLVDSVVFSPAVPVPTAWDDCALGGYVSGYSFYGYSNLHLDEWLVWEGQLDADQHAFVYSEIRKSCSGSNNCVWGYDLTEEEFDALNGAQSVGTPQCGDFWIIED